MSKELAVKLAIGALAVAFVKVYGDYKYYAGKCDANNFWKIIVDAQEDLIQDLLDERK